GLELLCSFKEWTEEVKVCWSGCCSGGLRSPAPGMSQFWEPPGQSLVKFGVMTQQLSQETSERDANTALLPTLH
ncbi:hypothetical protein HGM15179_005089, partial [Zosterops borbonicus]